MCIRRDLPTMEEWRAMGRPSHICCRCFGHGDLFGCPECGLISAPDLSQFCMCCVCQGKHCFAPHPGHSHNESLITLLPDPTSDPAADPAPGGLGHTPEDDDTASRD